MTNITFSLVKTDDDQFVTVFVAGREPLPASSSHPNFDKIVAACVASTQGEDLDPDQVADLFDVAATVQRKFERLSERITVENGVVKLDGDPVRNSLTEQILTFMDEDEDFEPLVNFYEKVVTNPLGDVKDGLFDWIEGQQGEAGHKVTITESGNLIGYKGVWPVDGQEGKYKPSRAGVGIVNGVQNEPGTHIVQGEGDVVEMPRSILSAPSHECGVGLHVGTWEYARSFGPVCLLVEFNPRDVVSAPDANASWKLRVCRYKVVGLADDQPVQTSVFHVDYDDGTEFDFDGVDTDDPDFTF